MGKLISNSFEKLNTDVAGLKAANNVTTNALNAEMFTQGDNQFIFQNALGNEAVGSIKPGYIVIGGEVSRNIAYIVSALFDDLGAFVAGEVGTYPSPNWTVLNITGEAPLEDLYRPLHNFSTSTVANILNDAANYTEPFNTNAFNFKFNYLAQVKLQLSYDSSVNILINDTINPIRLINSRFKLSDDGTKAILADRRGTRDTNVYSNSRFAYTKLFKQSDRIVDLSFDGLIGGGQWKPGGYKFYFKYSDSDGNLTDVIEGSSLVAMAENTEGALEIVNKAVVFKLRNLDPKFPLLKVYYSYSTGVSGEAATSLKEIAKAYNLPPVSTANTTMTLTLYGNEETYDIPIGDINLTYSNIDTVKAIEQHQYNLVLANAKFNTDAYRALEEKSALLLIKEAVKDLDIVTPSEGYRKPLNNYYNVGYWDKETYELAIVYILKDGKGLTPAYPIRGLDNISGTETYNTFTIAQLYSNLFDEQGYLTGSPLSNENRRGTYRTSNSKILLKSDQYTEVKYFQVDLAPIYLDSTVLNLTDGFFFVRRERIKDCVVQGIICNAARFPLSSRYAAGEVIPHALPGGGTNTDPVFHLNRINIRAASNYDPYVFLQEIRTSIGKDSPEGTKIIPAPGRIYAINQDGTNRRVLNLQGKVYPDPYTDPKDFVFYSSDMLVNPSLYNTLFQSNLYSLAINGTNTLNTYSPGVVLGTEPIGELKIKNGTFVKTHDTILQAEALYINETQDAHSSLGFSTRLDRNLYYHGFGEILGSPGVPIANLSAFAAADGLQYSDYVGLRVKNNSILLNVLLNNDLFMTFNYTNLPAIGVLPDTILLNSSANGNGDTGTDTGDYINRMTNGFTFGVPTNMYKSTNGILLSGGAWKAKYAHNQSNTYFPCTKRIKWADLGIVTDANNYTVVNIFQGDCFIDYTIKRLCYGLGIPGVKTATSWEAYYDGNQDAGLASKGVVFPLVNESNFNSALRTPEKVTDLEKAVYGKNRTFLLKDQFNEEHRANRQSESKAYNFGYNYVGNLLVHSGINTAAPVNGIAYTNRIFVSDRTITTDFANGYNRFAGFNFRDYNVELGSIQQLISHNDALYAIMERGVVQIPINQRSYVNDDQGGVFIDNANVLGQYGMVKSDKFGTVHPFSIGKSNTAVYGYDYTKNTIWSIQGRDFKVISDYNIRSLLEQYIYKLYNWVNVRGRDIGTLIKFTNDAISNKVYFTFLNAISGVPEVKAGYYAGLDYDDGITHSLVKYDKINLYTKEDRLISTIQYDELDQVWRSQTSWNPIHYFNIKGKFFTFNALRDKDNNDGRYSLWQHGSKNVPTCMFYNDQSKHVVEFVIIDNPAQQKILENIMLVCNRTFPNRCTYSVENYVDYETLQAILPYTVGADPYDESTTSVDLLKQRHESVDIKTIDFSISSGTVRLINKFTKEEAERLKGASFVSGGITYIIGGIIPPSDPNTLVSTQIFQINGLNIVPATILPSENISKLDIGIIHQNMEYIENELHIEVGKNIKNSPIRDKVIRVRIMYEGNKYVQIFNVVSKILYSHG